MCLNQTIIFHFQSLKGTLLFLTPLHFFGSVIVMPEHTLKVSNFAHPCNYFNNLC